MKKIIYLSVFVTLMLATSGCLSITAHCSEQKLISKPYDISVNVVEALAHPSSWSKNPRNPETEFDPALKCICWNGLLLALPFELVTDTLFLPYDFLMWLDNRKSW